MKTSVTRLVVIFTFFVVTAAGALAQGNSGPVEANGRNTPEILSELRLTRQLLQQFRMELRQLQVAAIRIRVQQDVVATKEARLDSARSEAGVTQDVLDEVQDRVKRLESIETSDADDAERQRLRTEIADAKRERDRLQQKLDALSNRDSQLTIELQAERARLAELIAALEAIDSHRVSERLETQPRPSDPSGSRNK